ncbi:MAG: OsmC family protein [Spirochaetota bacterium]
MKSTARWVQNYQSVVDNGRNHAVVTDLPKGKNGEDMGATALELAVMGLSGCISTIFVLVAGKMHLELSGLVVELEAEQPDGASTITTVNAVVRVRSDADRNKLEKCLEKTLKTCPVGVLYEQAGITIEHTLVVE